MVRRILEPKPGKDMGRVMVEVIVEYVEDVRKAQRGEIPPDKIRRIKVPALVDSGATFFCMPESLIQPMKTLLKCALPLATVACGCTFGTQPLPEGFEVRATGVYRWFPFPFAEGGTYYDFIGVGWLEHDERVDDVCLVHKGCVLAVAPHRGRDGWKLTGAGRRMLDKVGWSVGGVDSGVLVGLARRADAPPSPAYQPRQRLAPGAPYLNSPDETKYLYEWTLDTEPLRVLDDPWDTVVFLVCSGRLYRRLAGFDASHYEWIGCVFDPDGDTDPGTYVLTFRLRDRRTQRFLSGRYTWEGRHPGSLGVEEEPQLLPSAPGRAGA